MWRLAVQTMVTIILFLAGLETIVLIGGPLTPTTTGHPGWALADEPLMLGGQVDDAMALNDCWGNRDYTASCQVSENRVAVVSLQIRIQNNTIVMLSYRADSLFHLLGLVWHMGPMSVIRQRGTDIYLRWEHDVYGLITRSPTGAALDYGLTVWRGAG